MLLQKENLGKIEKRKNIKKESKKECYEKTVEQTKSTDDESS